MNQTFSDDDDDDDDDGGGGGDGMCFRALNDIEESIRELNYYRQVIFKTCK